MAVSAENEDDDQVDDQADGGDRHGFHAFDGLRILPALPGFGEDLYRDYNQRDAVDKRGQHFHTMVAISMAVIRRQGGEAQSEVAQPEGKDVRKDMRCVREQSQTASPIAANDLGNQNDGSEYHGEDEAVFDSFVGMR